MSPRSQDNSTIFLIGLLCLVLSLGLILFALYILPFLLWNLAYDIPSIITEFIAVLEDNYNYDFSTCKIIVWLSFIIPGLIAGYIAYYISNLLDKEEE